MSKETGENGSEDRDVVKAQLPPLEVCGELDEYKREEQRLPKQRKSMAVLRSDNTRRSSNSFNGHFTISVSILGSHFRCTWTTDPKHVPRLLTPSRTCRFKGY